MVWDICPPINILIIVMFACLNAGGFLLLPWGLAIIIVTDVAIVAYFVGIIVFRGNTYYTDGAYLFEILSTLS
jgi:hypothetical protein